ncbi:MAG: rRNA maturation RNase YbeY [Bacilli bacterium]|nr:rRNA maturation RNase YbeY [Bacilli bacterium]
MELSFSSYKSEFDYLEDVYTKIMEYTFKHLKLKCEAIISVSIIDNKEIHQINKMYRNVDKETDVISFAFLDNDDEEKKNLKKKGALVDLGEIYISLPKAMDQAKEYGHSLERELDFLFLHGLLHLLGYDHMEKEDEIVMFNLQDEILTALGVTR